MFGGDQSATAPSGGGVSEDQLLAAAKSPGMSTGSTDIGKVAAGCPRLNISSEAGNHTTYEAGRQGDGLAVIYRGEITKTARECSIAGSNVSIKYGFSGRVLLGPKGQAGNVTLPVTLTVVDGNGQQVASDNVTLDVFIGPDKPIGYFSSVRNVAFDVPMGSRAGDFKMIVGFPNQQPQQPQNPVTPPGFTG